jgi:hypothetical protein
MLFIHQQIQSFLNLGICKEYPVMAKPQVPKAGIDTQETVSTTSVPQSDSGVGPETASAATRETKMTQAAKTERRKTARKPAIVRTEPRANLVPINLDDEIRRLAYLLSERRGFESGHETEDWLAAEREVRQRYHQQTA